MLSLGHITMENNNTSNPPPGLSRRIYWFLILLSCWGGLTIIFFGRNGLQYQAGYAGNARRNEHSEENAYSILGFGNDNDDISKSSDAKEASVSNTFEHEQVDEIKHGGGGDDTNKHKGGGDTNEKDGSDDDDDHEIVDIGIASSSDLINELIKRMSNNDGDGDSDVKKEAEAESETEQEEELPTTPEALAGSNNNQAQVYTDAFPDLPTIRNITTYENLHSHIHFDIPVPQNLSILFFGDSLSRYQYLDLVYFLSHGAWVEPDDHSSLVWAGNHSTWNAFYNFTNFNLKPYEECDCFRNEGIMNHGLLNENRYFWDEERNNSVTYLQKFGTAEFKTSWNVTDIHDTNHILVQHAREVSYFGHTDWLGTIQEFICKMMDPKPSIVFFNSGLWGDGGLANSTTQTNIVDALKHCDITSVYKTTTKMQSEQDSNMREYEEQMCNKTDMCYDISWTGPLVPERFYWDRAHMTSPIYSMLNVQMLALLASREEQQHEKQA
mmetsp:Transcript_11624/g.16969  ORF Transcript_11624/g.16969 Transcript_11624/m.16969 type:complete len:496 (-) Transcript_11624:30-1517(-)